MAFNFSRKAQPVEGEAKKPDQKKQMIILLLIIALFGYLYFFTGMLRPQGEDKPINTAQVVSPTMVKQPMPKRGADSAVAEKKAEPAKPEPAPAVPVAKPAPAAPAPVVKPVVAKPTTAPKPSPAAKAVVPAPKPAPVKTAVPAKPVALPAQTVAKAAVPPAPVVASQPTGKFTLLVGEFPTGSLLKEIKNTIKKAGVSPVHVKMSKVNKQMHRLVVGEYAEHDQALREVQKLKKNGVDAFMGDTGDKSIVYAGSYLYADRAEIERDRLLKLGMNATIMKSEHTVQLAKVTAGTFNTAEKAQAAATKLKEKGLITDLVELGK